LGRSGQPAKPVASFAAWKAEAVAELSTRHGVKASTIPERVWKRLYVQNMTPQDAPEQAAVSAYNTRSPDFRLHK
jgi:hypothetical protein